MRHMISTIWRGDDFPLLIVCLVLGVLALAFFVTLFVADSRDAKRRAEARKAIQRVRKRSTASGQLRG